MIISPINQIMLKKLFSLEDLLVKLREGGWKVCEFVITDINHMLILPKDFVSFVDVLVAVAVAGYDAAAVVKYVAAVGPQ